MTDILTELYTKAQTRSHEEAKTLALFDVKYMEAMGIEWSNLRQVVAMVFRARWSAALDIEAIAETAKVLGSLVDTPDVAPMLKRMVRAKILRSYVSQGRRLWEVNF